jgi:hypothetical protein
MAKLYAELSSDKGGRIVGKGGNEYITMRVKNGNIAVFEIEFRPDDDGRGKLLVMSYADGITKTIPYM